MKFQIAKGLNLQCVGWIFTDLVPLNANNGTVRHLRHADTHFLSAHEVITAAHLQNLHPNPCRFSPEGDFGSKFATVIITGDSSNQVPFFMYINNVVLKYCITFSFWCFQRDSA